jgi:hypothetical protein
MPFNQREAEDLPRTPRTRKEKMKRAALILALSLPWIITFWAVAVCIGASRKNNDREQQPYRQSDYSGVPQPAEARPFAHDKEYASGNSKKEKDWTDWTAMALGAAGFLVSLYAFSAASRNADAAEASARAAEASVTTMDVTSKRQLRAYVSFQILNPNPPEPNKEYQFSFKCTNHGQTPAKNIGFRGGVWRLELPLNEIPAIAPGFDENRMNLFPGKDNARTIQTNTTTVFDGAECFSVYFGAGKHAFVVGLRITYTDIFDEPHITEEYLCMYGGTGKWQSFTVPNNSKIT